MAHHTSVVYGDKMYLYGGSGTTSENDLFYALDLKNYKWDVIRARGDLPKPRDEHTCVLYEGCMVVFGGFIDGERVNEIYRYYIRDNKWERVQALGDE